jgi:regulator of replication initiation timing
MSNKNKTVSFRINETKFDELRGIADENNLSLSSVFRDYVDEIVSHDGHVEIVPKHALREQTTENDADEFPQTVGVPKSFVREHERLELECEHLRDQLDEYKAYTSRLKAELEKHQEVEEEMVRLEEVDFEAGTSLIIE